MCCFWEVRDRMQSSGNVSLIFENAGKLSAFAQPGLCAGSAFAVQAVYRHVCRTFCRRKFLKPMKFRFFLLLTCLLAAAFFRCKPSDEEFSSARDLRIVFSADTLSFDTLLATRPSLSKRLTVRNPNSSAVMLESVRLEKDGGPYELIVNGRKANAVQNLPLFGKDSLLVVVDLTVPEKDQSEPFPVQDRILFELNGSRQQVVLEAWGQQARFFGKTRISKDCTFTAARPYLLSDTLFVEKNAQLTIEAGAKIYCQPNACVWIDGTLDVRGDSDGRVVFRNERSDGRYAYAPGQWKGIVFNNTGENHRMVYADVLNAVDGIQVLQQEPGGLLELNGVIVQNALKNVLYAENTDGLGAFSDPIVLANTASLIRLNLQVLDMDDDGEQRVFTAQKRKRLQKTLSAVMAAQHFLCRDLLPWKVWANC